MRDKRHVTASVTIRALDSLPPMPRTVDITHAVMSIDSDIGRSRVHNALITLMHHGYVDREFLPYKGKTRDYHCFMYTLTAKGHSAAASIAADPDTILYIGQVGVNRVTELTITAEKSRIIKQAIEHKKFFELLVDRGPSVSQRSARTELHANYENRG